MALSIAYTTAAAQIEARLEAALAYDASAPHHPVLSAMAYATLGGGKRGIGHGGCLLYTSPSPRDA